MYRHILARDLRRKKTMNLITLLFVILASAFIASSLNIIVPVTTAIDDFFEKAGLPDFFIISINDEENDKKIADLLASSENVSEYYIDEGLFISSDYIYSDGEAVGGNILMLLNIDAVNQKYFDENNEPVTSVSDNSVRAAYIWLEEIGKTDGGELEIKIGDSNMSLEVTGSLKDALTGSAFMGLNRAYVNTETYEKIEEMIASDADATFSGGRVYGISSDNTAELSSELGDTEITYVFADSIDIIAFCYIIDMVIAGILMVVSIVLILIALVVLRFTIIFTLEEEFREIGIMKAIGLKNRTIRGLYLIKYLALAVVGSLIGLIISVPFSEVFLAPVEKNVVIDNSSSFFILSVISVITVVAIIMLFCYGCTRRVIRFSPIDAIRNGNSGERFGKKSVMRLSKTHFPVIPFMAVNDVLSELKRFVVMIIAFLLGTLMMIIPLNSVNTLNGKGTIDLLGVSSKYDVYLGNTTVGMKMMTMGEQYINDTLDEVSEKLEENGMPAVVGTVLYFKVSASSGELHDDMNAVYSFNIAPDEYVYTEGTPPINANEIALTVVSAEKLGVTIGDTVEITVGSKEYEPFIVTALYQTLNNMGEGMRFSNAVEGLPFETASGSYNMMARFTDNPSESEIEERVERIEELYSDFEAQTLEQAVTEMMGDTVSPLSTVAYMTIVLVIIVDMMVAVLMMKSFIIKEKGQIATLKSIGFTNGSLILWQSLRIGFVMIVSTLLGILLSEPMTAVSSGQVFAMMGASQISFEIKPLEVFVMYPLITLVATMAAAIITALGIKKIQSQDVGNIE